MLRRVLAKLYRGLADPDYNYVGRTAPTEYSGVKYYHWYLSIIPRLTKMAGFELGSFDVVTMFEVIEHLRDPAGVLRVVWRLLRDGGLLYLTTPNYDSLSRYLLGSSWRIILPREHLFYFTAASLGPLLRMSGYEVRSCRTTGLDYHAILNHWVFRREGSSWAAVQEARERIESSGALRMLKRCADNVLSLVRLGDTIKIFAEKRG